jgi:hypothetical protein
VEHGNLLDDRSIELLLQRQAFLVPTLVTSVALKEEGPEHGLPRESWDKVDQVLIGGLGRSGAGVAGRCPDRFRHRPARGHAARENEEFRIRAEVQPVIDIIRSATTVAADLVGMTGEIGTLAPGARADLVVLAGDPLLDIGMLADHRNIRTVVQSGDIVRHVG